MTFAPTPLDYVPVSRLDANTGAQSPSTRWKQPSGLRRGITAGVIASVAVGFAYFFPGATVAFLAMCFAVWAGEKLFLYFEMPAEEQS